MQATGQTCNLTTNACGPCSAHSDCSSGVCMTGGTCAAPSQVAYVNNNPAICSDTAHTSTPTAPYCKIADATILASPLPYIVVAPSATSYDAVSLTAVVAAIGPLTIIGPGHNAATSAKIAPATGPAISIASSGNAVTLTVDGLELIGAGGGAPAAGAKCQVVTSGAPSLTILNSYIHSSGLYGVDSSSCSLTLDANIIGANNTGGGVSINGGTVKVSNNLIVANGSNGPGVLFAGSVSGTWWFNTVANNSYKTGPTTNQGAYNCSTTGNTLPLLQAGIVWGNDKSGGASFDSARCAFTYTDIDDTTTPTGGTNTGNFNTNPTLTAGTLPAASYRITTGSAAENVVTSSTGLTGGTLPAHDVDGNARPRASTGGYDVGASQAP